MSVSICISIVLIVTVEELDAYKNATLLCIVKGVGSTNKENQLA